MRRMTCYSILMDYERLNPCPLCGAIETVPYATCSDHASSRLQYLLLRCPACGVVFTDNHPEEDEMEQFETLDSQIRRADSPEGITERLYRHVRRRMLRRKAGLVVRQSYRDSGTLLNYGAKRGFFSDHMERKGWKVTSVDRHHENRQFSLEHFHHRMSGMQEMSDFTPETFDVITLWHVFEHENEPERLLDTFHRILRPGGILVMSCPNICSTDAMHYGPYWAAYDVPRHLWHFNPVSLNRLVHRHGFTLMHHEKMPYDCFYISIMSEQYMMHRLAFLRGMAYGLHSWLVSLTRRGRSSSIVYVFRKTNGQI